MTDLCDADQRAVRCDVAFAAGKVIEYLVCHADDLALDDFRPLPRGVLWILQAAFPLVNRPTGKIVFGELRENGTKIHLTIPKRPVARRPLQPRLVSRVHPLPATRIELRVFHMKALDSLVVDVDELQVVQTLLDEVAGVIVDVAARVIVDFLQEPLEGHAIKEIRRGVDFEAEVHAFAVGVVQDRSPDPRKLVEPFLDKAVGDLREGVPERPQKRAGKCTKLGQSKVCLLYTSPSPRDS